VKSDSGLVYAQSRQSLTPDKWLPSSVLVRTYQLCFEGSASISTSFPGLDLSELMGLLHQGRCLTSYEIQFMQYTESFQSKSDYLARYSSKLKAVVAVAHSKSSKKRSAHSARRFNVDSWLSRSDANLLLRKRAQYEVRRGNYVTAIEILDQLIAYEPDNPSNFVNRGLMHSHLQRYDKAMANYNKAIQLNPELDQAYSNRANLHAKRQNWADAIADYDQAIDLNPLNIRARLNQAITFREIDDYEEALLCLDIAIFFRPQSATLYSERGRTYHLRGHWNQAIADYTIARSLAEDSSLKDISSPARIIRKVLVWMNSLVSI